MHHQHKLKVVCMLLICPRASAQAESSLYCKNFPVSLLVLCFFCMLLKAIGLWRLCRASRSRDVFFLASRLVEPVVARGVTSSGGAGVGGRDI